MDYLVLNGELQKRKSLLVLSQITIKNLMQMESLTVQSNNDSMLRLQRN